LIGSIRREVFKYVIILNERHLKRILASYVAYCHRFRTRQSRTMDCLEPWAAHSLDHGRGIAVPEMRDSIIIMSAR
jgi:hypothetical protein